MLHRFWLLLLWLGCACALASVPERPRFRMIGPAQGLPATEVKALVRDHDGYLWIGTADGLARYDGVEMRVWRHDPKRSTGLPGNNIQALLVDASNRLWVAVEGEGISILDAQRSTFQRLQMTNTPGMGSDDIWSFALQGKNVWFGTYDGGLHRMTPDGKIQRYTHESGDLPSDTVLALAVDASGALWAGTDAGLVHQQGGRFVAAPLPDAQDTTPLVYSLTWQRDGLWAGTSAGAWRWQDGQWSQPAWSPMFQRPNAVMAIATDRDGGHWIASQRGLWLQHGSAAPVPVRAGNGAEIPRVLLTLLLQPDGALWAPVAGVGLGYLHSDWHQMARFQNERDGLKGTLYRALAPARNGGFWLGGFNGVVERLGSDGEIKTLPEAQQEKLAGIKLFSIAEDAQGNVWLGHRLGLIRVGIDGSLQQWGKADQEDAAPSGLVDHLLVANDGSLWLSAPGGGVQQRDVRTGKVLQNFAATAASGLGSADIEALVLSPSDEVFIADDAGVLVLDAKAHRFRRIASMSNDRVYALAFDGPDTLWLQRQVGLFQYRRSNGQWRQTSRVDSSQGVPALGAAGLDVDSRHRVWLSTSRGLFRWDPKTGVLRRHGMQDGDASEEYQDRGMAMSAQGVIAVSAADGSLLLVDTDAPDPKPTRPLLKFDRAAVRRNGHWQELASLSDLRFAYRDREFRFGARLLAFDDPGLNQYWAKLDGFDRGWVALGASADRVFTGLAPGNYVLRMRARDAAGNVAEEQALAFRVLPPWWLTLWAKSLYVVVIVATLLLLGWLYRRRLQRQHAWQLAEHKRALAEQASEAKSRFLATLGHEVRTPMTGVLGMAELLQNTPLDASQSSYVESIHRAGQHLLRLVNDALDLARIEAGKLELRNADFSVRALLNDVAGLMAPVAERKGLVFVEDVAADVPTVVVGDRTRIQQILLNLIGNAVKFTDTGHVALETVALHPHGLRFIVADTGPGLNAEQQARLFRRFEQAEGAKTSARYGGSGLGLAISQELAAAMGGSITVDSVPGKGTRFVVELPLTVSAAAHSLEGAAAPVSSTPSLDCLRLLLVEDDPIVAQTMVGLLRAQGHHVVHVGHGLGALTEAALQTFDVALLDLDLPGMDGLALAQTLRVQAFTAPLLAVTARSDGDAEAQALAAGFDGFLRKPVTGAMLQRVLAEVLQKAG